MTTKTWSGVSANWNVSADWSPSGVPGTLDLATLGSSGSYTVSVTGFEQPGTIAITDPHATLSVGSGGTLAVVSALELGAGVLALGYSGALLAGGTLALGGGTITGSYDTLDGVTVFGNLSQAGLTNFDVIGGLTIDTASGATGGTLSLDSVNIQFLDSETLDNATLVATTPYNTLGSGYGDSLTLGPHLNIVVGSGAVSIGGTTLINRGAITVAAGGDVSLTASGGSFANTGTIAVAAGGTLALSASLTEAQFQTLLGAGITDLGTLELEGTLFNTGSLLSNGTIAALEVAATVIGGTIVNTGSLTFGTGALDGVTIAGPLVVQPGSNLQFGAGTTLLSAAFTTGGTIIDTGYQDYLSFGAGETLTNTLIEAKGPGLIIYGATTLALGSGVTAALTGSAEFGGTAVANAGSIVVSAGAAADFATNTVSNSGVIAAAAGGTIEIGIYGINSTAISGLPLVYSGATPVLAAGATLVVGTEETTAQLLALLGGQRGVTVEVFGTLVNTGNTLLVGSGGIADLVLDGTIIGGAVDNLGGTVVLAGGTLEGESFLGPAVINVADTVDVIGGISFHGTDGVSPGALTLAGGENALVFGDTETLDNVTVSVTGIPNYYYQPSSIYGGTLTLGAHATVATSSVTLLSAATLTNDGNLAAAGVGAEISLYGTSIVNAGIITIGSRAALGVDLATASSNYYSTATALPLQLSNAGTIAFAAGASLDLGGLATETQLAALLGGQTGVTTALLGTLKNGGDTISATAAGLFPNLLLEGDLQGGTVVGAGGTLLIGTGTLDGVSLQGGLTLDGSGTLIDGVGFAGLGGSGPATLAVGGYGDGLVLGDTADTLANVDIVDPGEPVSVSSLTPSLNIAASATVSLSGGAGLTLTGTSIASAGTITTGGIGETVSFASANIAQTGLVSIGSHDVLALDVSAYATGLEGQLSLTGGFNLANGATLELGEQQTTAQLQSLLAQIGASGAAVELLGTLVNTGATLAIAPGLLGNVTLDDDVVGGVITQTGGTLAVSGGTLDGVQVQSPLTLTGGVLYLRDGTQFETSSGGPGGTLVASGYTTVWQEDAGTFDNVHVNVSGNLSLAEYINAPLTLGSGAVFAVQPGGGVALGTSNNAIASAASFLVAGGTAAYAPSSFLEFNAPTIATSGSIGITAGATLGLDVGNTSALSFSNTGTVSLASGATLAVGGEQTSAQLASLLAGLWVPGVAVEFAGSIDNSGNTLSFASGGTLGNAVLAGRISGGTINEAGGTVDYLAGAALSNLTWDGPITLAKPGDYLTIGSNVALRSASGGSPGTLSLASSSDNLVVSGVNTLDQLALSVSGTLGDGLSVSTLTLGPASQTSVTGELTVTGSTLINAGTIAVSGANAELLIQTNSFINQGVLTVGSADVLGLGNFYSNGIVVTNIGAVNLVSGATLDIGGILTTAQLLSLLGSISNSGVVVDLTGTILNSGATLGAAASPLLDNLILNADVIGGVVQPGTFGVRVAGGTLDGVTWDGNLLVTAAQANLTIQDGLTLNGASGGPPGLLNDLGNYDIFTFSGTETLDNASVLIQGFNDSFNDTAALTFGPNLTLAVSNLLSPRQVDTFTLAPATVFNAGTIAVSGTNTELLLDGTSFVNNGLITVGSGDILALSGPYAGNGVALSGTGTVSLANGSTLEIGGTLTTAQLLAEVGSLAHPGVAIELVGKVINTGAVLDAAASGPLANLILGFGADIIGGTIDQDSGSVTVLGGTLDGVTFEGPLNLAGTNSYLNVLDGLTMETTAGGLPGTILAGGSSDLLAIGNSGTAVTSQTLANVVLIDSGLSQQTFNLSGPQTGTLVLASSVLAEVSAPLVLTAENITNAGTFVIDGTYSTASLAFSGVQFDSPTFSNSGTILVEPGNAVGFSAVPSFSNSGEILVAPYAAVGVDADVSTSAFTNFVGSLVSFPDTVVGIGPNGTLENINTTLNITSTGSLSFVGFASALVVGGTIINQGTALFTGFDSFENVTWEGPLTLAYPNTEFELVGSSSLVSGGAGMETIALLGSQDVLSFDPENLLLSGPTLATPVVSQSLTNALVSLGTSAIGSSSTLLLDGPGSLTFGAGVTIEATGSTVIDSLVYPGLSGSAVLLNQGSIFSNGTLLLNSVSRAASSYSPGGSAIIVNAGVIAAGGGTLNGVALGINGSFLNSGQISVAGPERFTVGGTSSLTNTGTIALSTGATLDVLASGLNAGTVVLADGLETVRIESAGTFTASLVSFEAGDTIDLPTVTDGGTLTPTATFASGLLDIYTGTGTLAAALSLPSPYAYGSNTFVVGSDGHGGTDVTTTTPCFLAGTRIATTEGYIAVEALRVGMHVPTLGGQLRPIVWIGQRHVDCAHHPRPDAVLPIRVCAGAFGARAPQRDLLLSPDHAVWQDGVLIPIQYLVNGLTIRRETRAQAHYFHIELDEHSVLFAEGLTTESYLDTGNREVFANGGSRTALFADFAARHWDNACAPLCVRGPLLTAVRRRVFAGLPKVEIPPPQLRAGERILPSLPGVGQLVRYSIPPGVASVMICSETGVPAELDAESSDRRPLGVAIAGLILNGRVIDLASPALGAGFYAFESGRRWTNGAAIFEPGARGAVRLLEIRVVERARSRRAAPTAGSAFG